MGVACCTVVLLSSLLKHRWTPRPVTAPRFLMSTSWNTACWNWICQSREHRVTYIGIGNNLFAEKCICGTCFRRAFESKLVVGGILPSENTISVSWLTRKRLRQHQVSRFGPLELKIASLGSEKINTGSLESEKSGAFASIPST